MVERHKILSVFLSLQETLQQGTFLDNDFGCTLCFLYAGKHRFAIKLKPIESVEFNLQDTMKFLSSRSTHQGVF